MALHLWLRAWSDREERMLVRVDSTHNRGTLEVGCTDEVFRNIATSLCQVLRRTTSNEPLSRFSRCKDSAASNSGNLSSEEVPDSICRDLGVYDTVNERVALAKYSVTPVDTKWIDTRKAFEDQKVETGQTCTRELLHWRRPKQQSPLQRTTGARSQASCVLPRSGPEACSGSLAHRRPHGGWCWKDWPFEKVHVRHLGCREQLGTRLAGAFRKMEIQLGLVLEPNRLCRQGQLIDNSR